MRELTFRGFLKKYVRSLSRSDTNSIYRLATEAASDNPRLQESLFLYALFSDKEQTLLSATKSPKLRQKYFDLLKKYNLKSMERHLRNSSPELPAGYVKVYKSYLSVKNEKQRDDHTKFLMRNRIVQMQREKGISTYRIYTDLRLNHGNINSYIKHGDCSKLSLESARNVMHYLENSCKAHNNSD